MKKLQRVRAFRQAGFMLIELLVVILIIATLAVTVFVALNPTKRLSDARDGRRWSDADTILTALHEYAVDNGGDVSGLGMTARVEYQLGTSASSCNTVGACTTMSVACLNLATPLAAYLKTIPFDPKSTVGSAAKTGYKVIKDNNGIFTVASCGSESAAISVSR